MGEHVAVGVVGWPVGGLGQLIATAGGVALAGARVGSGSCGAATGGIVGEVVMIYLTSLIFTTVSFDKN